MKRDENVGMEKERGRREKKARGEGERRRRKEHKDWNEESVRREGRESV